MDIPLDHQIIKHETLTPPATKEICTSHDLLSKNSITYELADLLPNSNSKANGRRMRAESNIQLQTQVNLATIEELSPRGKTIRSGLDQPQTAVQSMAAFPLVTNQKKPEEFTTDKAIKSNYWELTPKWIHELDGNIAYEYYSKVLNTKKSAEFNEILLNIYSHDGGKFIQEWIQFKNDESVQLKDYSLGDELIVYIDPMQPDRPSIADPITGEKYFAKMPVSYQDEKNWQISPSTLPISNTCMTLDGTKYSIYAGEIVRCDYTKEMDDHNTTSEANYMDHHLNIEIKIEGEGTKHYTEHRIASSQIASASGKPLNQPDQFNDDVLRMLRNWKQVDKIKILVNQYYPGFWWIVNESRNEAVYVAQGKALKVDRDLWSKLT